MLKTCTHLQTCIEIIWSVRFTTFRVRVYLYFKSAIMITLLNVYPHVCYRMFRDDAEFVPAAADTIWNLLTCQHENLDIHTLSTHYFNLTSPIQKDDANYFKCLQIQENAYFLSRFNKSRSDFQRLPETLHVSRTGLLNCLAALKSKCKQSSTVINKYIRMSMPMAEKIFHRSAGQEVKVIHLFRDPRAMLDSQLRKNDVNVQHFPTFINRTRQMCQNMLDDLNYAETLKQTYPGRIITVRYETLVDYPIQSVKSILSFLGLPYLESDENYVLRTRISNRTFPRWRLHIPQSHLEVVDKYCRLLYDRFGYIPLKHVQDVHNIQISAHSHTYI